LVIAGRIDAQVQEEVMPSSANINTAETLPSLLLKLDNAKIGKQHVKITVAAFANCVLDFFDYFTIAFVLAYIARSWNLTFGQSSLILYSYGMGAFIGAFSFGWMADRIGRRKVLFITALTFSIPTAFLYFVPDRNWVYVVVCRFVVGLGSTGLIATLYPALQEVVPSRYRGSIAGIVASSAAVGQIMASGLAGFLSPIVGWRALFLVGACAALIALVAQAWLPASPRWLALHGRYREARKSIAWILGSKAKDPDAAVMAEQDAASIARPPAVKWTDIFKYRRSVICSCLIQLGSQTASGYILWGTTIFVLLLGVTPAKAAQLFMGIFIFGIVGRFSCGFLADYMGRRKAGCLVQVLGGTLLILAGHFYKLYWGRLSVLWLLMIAANFFLDGAFAILGPYVSEPWPRHLRASGHGFVYGVGSLGRAIGPMILGLFAGGGNLVTPHATMAALFPAFLFWGLTVYGVAIVFLFGYETKGKTLEEIERMVSAGRGSAGQVAERAVNTQASGA
jgi:putative MFS transporter